MELFITIAVKISNPTCGSVVVGFYVQVTSLFGLKNESTMCEFVDCDITPHRTAFVDVYEYSDFV
jgi:hypothetical protein